MSALSPEATAALSRHIAHTLIREVAAAGGDIPDVLTVATATAARVLCMALPEGADAGAVERMTRMLAECVPVFRSAEREGVVA